MEIQHNHEAKSLLAKLLASENITVQHSPHTKTAWFDVKKRVLMLPVWREMSNDLYDLLVVHEVGHALDTPAENFVENIKAIAAKVGETSPRALGAIKGFLNVIEDVRIDKRQKRRFPGSRRNYVKGYKELIDRNFFGTATKDVNAMNFIDRLNIYNKGGVMLGIKFSDEEKALLRKVEAAETFQEVLELTAEIYAWSKTKMEEISEEEDEDFDFPKKKESYPDGEEEGDDFDWGDNDSSGDDDSEDDDSDSSDGDSDEEDAEDSEGENSRNGSSDTEKDEDESEDSQMSGAGEGEEMIPESLTEKTWQEKSSELIQDSSCEYIYAKLPKINDYDKMVLDYKIVLTEQRADLARSRFDADWINAVRRDLNEFKTNENNSLSFMVKEFEMRKAADEYTRTSIAKTGVIDTNKLHSYKYNDDLFRRITTVATGKNHGFVMFVDWSGSMQSDLGKTVRQLLSLVMFCRRVQVPFEVYTFLSLPRIGNGFTAKTGELEISTVTLRNVLSSRMSIRDLNDAMFHLFIMASGARLHHDSMGATPLNPAIIAASEVVNRFKAKSKVQIVNTIFLTDGDSDGMSGMVHGVNTNYGQVYKYIIQDDITKKSYDLPASKSKYNIFGNETVTPIFLKILKDRTGCNLIGFFITSSGFANSYHRYNGYGNDKHLTEKKKCWSDNGFFGVSNAGYDEYYILNSTTFKIASSELKVNKDATKRAIAGAFMKFSEKKTVSRVLLSQVVKRITA